LPCTALKFNGAVGAFITTVACSVSLTLACVPAPSLLTARTLNVYVVPTFKLANVCSLVLEAATQLAPLSLDTSYRAIAAPPLLVGAAQLRTTFRPLCTALKSLGADAMPLCVVADTFNVKARELFPAAFTAIAVKLNVPVCDGVPEINPPDESVNPFGSEPFVTLHVNGAVPVATRVCE